jgi:hypothetical protein
MSVPIVHIQQLTDGALSAREADLYRLGRHFELLAKVGQMIRDGVDLRTNFTVLPDLIASGATIARDLRRSPTVVSADPGPLDGAA